MTVSSEERLWNYQDVTRLHLDILLDITVVQQLVKLNPDFHLAVGCLANNLGLVPRGKLLQTTDLNHDIEDSHSLLVLQRHW